MSFPGPSGQLRGSAAAPTGAFKGAVLVVHDIQGLTAHYTDLVGRFAGAGYATLCVDLLSGQAAASNSASALRSVPDDQLLTELRAGISELGRKVPGLKIGAVGFGFGGSLLWKLLAAGDPILAAAVDFYGRLESGLDFHKSHAAVLALYPSGDSKMAEAQDNADQALVQANLPHHSVLYPDSKTGFFDNTSPRYSSATAAKAWDATLDWFSHHLGSATSPAH